MPLVLGLAGGTGCGKTTLATKLKERCGDDAVILSHDFYYKPNRHLTFEERKALNFDHPDSLDTDLMIDQLHKLRNNEAIERPVYSFSEHTRLSETVKVEPAKVIILEGILIFHNRKLCEMMDIRVFIDADSDVRILRRLTRDVNDRGRTIESVINQYLGTVKPMHERYVESSKKNADIIVPHGAHNPVAFQMIADRIQAAISE